MAEAQGVALTDISFVVEQRCSSIRDGMASASLAVHKGLRAMGVEHDSRTTKVMVRLFSTEHHLQRMHDIDTLMPRQSLVKPLRELRPRIEYSHVASPFTYSMDS